MLETELPRIIEPLKFVEQHDCLKGTWALADMLRLLEMCYPEQSLGEAVFSIEGGIDQQGLRYLKGSIEADILLQCQRCLRAMTYHIKTNFLLSSVCNDAEAAQLPVKYEALYLIQPEVDLLTIIEDELLLTLPLVPKHKKGDCKAKPILQADIEEGQKTERPHPFAELATLKSQLRKKRKRG